MFTSYKSNTKNSEKNYMQHMACRFYEFLPCRFSFFFVKKKKDRDVCHNERY